MAQVKTAAGYVDASAFVKTATGYAAAAVFVKTAAGYVSAGSAPAFDPASRFAGGQQGAWYDPSDLSTLFQDTAFTVPVTTAGQPVRGMLDKSGRGNHMIANSGEGPLYELDGALPCLRANGTTTRMYTAAGVPLTAVDKLSCSVAVRVEGTGNQCVFSNNSSGVARFLMLYLAGASPALRVGLNAGGDTQIRIPAKGAAPYKAVNTAVLNIAGATATDEVVVREDGLVPTQTVAAAGPAGTGNFSAQPFSLFSASSAGALFSFQGLFYGSISVAEISTSGQLLEIEQYLGPKAGVFF